MKWLSDQNISGPILFIGYFLLYGLEYFIPLVAKRSSHFKTNALLAVLLISLNLIFTSTTIGVSHWVKVNNIGLFNWIPLSVGWQLIISLILLDLWSGYFAHLIFHKSAWLWQLHTVHHTDELVDVTTTFRQHPAESIIRIMFNLSGMIILGIPSWILLIYMTLSTINSQIEHANIRIPEKLDRILQLLIVTPNMHKIHHSKYQQETDSNYSNIFSFWDRIFNTYNYRGNYSSIHYGLDYIDNSKRFTFLELLHLPFKYFKKQEGRRQE